MADQEAEEFDPLAESVVESAPAANGHGALVLPEADPDEEPPEPEGHPMSQKMRDFIVGDDYFQGPLPPDIAAIWAHPPHRVGDEATARILIAAWGLDSFRGSALHNAAVQAAAREANTAPSRARFKAEREKGKKGK